MWIGANVGWGGAGGIPYWGCKSNLCGGGSGRGRCVQFNWGGSGANVDWGECGLGRCVIVGRIPYWGCKSNLCGADLEGGGASNLTGADRGRMWIGAVSPASLCVTWPSWLWRVGGCPTQAAAGAGC